jgi:hypothetical protein
MAQQGTMMRNKLQWIAVLIAVLSFLVAFTGANFGSIVTYFNSIMGWKPDFVLASGSEPSIFPNNFTESLSVSKEYFVVTSVNIGSGDVNLNEPLKFRVSFENKGKTAVAQPKVTVCFVDFLRQVWLESNLSLNNDYFTKGFNVQYEFPSPDHRIVGTWSVFVMVYDDANGALVSYLAKEFTTVDSPTGQTDFLSALFATTAVSLTASTVVYMLVRSMRAGYRKIQKKKRVHEPSEAATFHVLARKIIFRISARAPRIEGVWRRAKRPSMA